MAQAAIKSSHSLKPPCYCDDCLRATAKSDQRRAEIQAILERLDALERAVQS